MLSSFMSLFSLLNVILCTVSLALMCKPSCYVCAVVSISCPSHPSLPSFYGFIGTVMGVIIEAVVVLALLMLGQSILALLFLGFCMVYIVISVIEIVDWICMCRFPAILRGRSELCSLGIDYAYAYLKASKL